MLVRLLIALSVLFSAFAQANAWDSYKARFVMPDGRVVDTGNGNVSHTEGQGFAMLMAVSLNDRQTFDKLWTWTEANLKNKENGLFYWRYNPVAPDPITDKNDATDGDMMIAWALLKAQKQWRENSYGIASDSISQALLKHTVISYAGYRVMLPGAKGFNLNTHINLNPSYFIFPAWQAFADRTHLVAWRELMSDGKKLVGKMGWGNANLPTDWVTLSADGKMKPADEWKPRMSYDAVRIPLYIRWQDPQSPLLAPWKAWWQHYQREQTPAWVNVMTNETSPYAMNGGLLAIRDFTFGSVVAEPQMTPQDDYYSASLKMLTWLAQRDISR